MLVGYPSGGREKATRMLGTHDEVIESHDTDLWHVPENLEMEFSSERGP